METRLQTPFVPGSPLANAVLSYRHWLHDAGPVRHLGHAREISAARAARAQLRRCANGLDAVAQRGAHRLLRDCEESCAGAETRCPPPDQLLSLAPLLAWVEIDQYEKSFPEQLAAPQSEGGDRPRYSELRFRRLLESQGAEVYQELRRALQFFKNKPVNTLWIAEAACYWNDEFRGPDLRRRWAYEYYSHLPKTG